MKNIFYVQYNVKCFNSYLSPKVPTDPVKDQNTFCKKTKIINNTKKIIFVLKIIYIHHKVIIYKLNLLF